MSTAVSVWEFPCPSQEFEEGPQVILAADTVQLRYDCEVESGGYAWAQLLFQGVAGFSFTAVHSCLPEHVDAYDQVVEVSGSTWLQELLSRRPYEGPELRHYRVFFDDVGCYDVAAENFEPGAPPTA